MKTMMLIGSALGTSLFIATMALKHGQYLSMNPDPLIALDKGITFAYYMATGLAVVGLNCALFFQKRCPKNSR
jgi:MFS transporter, DHA2 family, lincomycin resistance protein